MDMLEIALRAKEREGRSKYEFTSYASIAPGAPLGALRVPRTEQEVAGLAQELELAMAWHRPILLPSNAFEIEFIYRQRYFWRRAAALTFIIALVGVLTGAG